MEFSITFPYSEMELFAYFCAISAISVDLKWKNNALYLQWATKMQIIFSTISNAYRNIGHFSIALNIDIAFPTLR